MGRKGTGEYPPDWMEIATRTKEAAGWKCVRCHHPNDPEVGRILTVHHLDMNKSNCEWWNIPALCQRCHLEIQNKVVMERRWMFEYSEWFIPYYAGYCAHRLGFNEARWFCTRYGQAIIDVYEGRMTMSQFTELINQGAPNESP